MYVNHQNAGDYGNQKMALGPLDLEFQTVVSLFVDAGDQNWVL